jgi:galactokinase
LIEPAAREFVAAFGEPPALLASAPGRVNLLGEHTDYNDGLVLPIAIPQRTQVALRTRADRQVHVRSAAFAQSACWYPLGSEARQHDWSDYVRGVTYSLDRAGLRVGGFEGAFASNVPVGAGLSSSAALEVALLRGLRQLFALPLDDLALAKVAQWGENNLVGAPVGILDPLACSLAEADAALFVDIRSLAFERLPLPSELELVVVDSGVRHDHATGQYGQRRRECQEAARLLGVAALRDVVVDDPRLAQLPPPLDRRARHVVTENARVLEAAQALRRGDGAALGRLFNASHVSQRDDFEVSHPAVDELVERAWRDADVLGARLTGGGFGGAMVALVKRGAARRVGTILAGGERRLLVPEPGTP